MKLYVARHGQTQWNLDQKICGRTDLPLTEEGHRQAQILADKAKELSLDVIISSPMLRARKTAAAVAAVTGLTVQIDARLIEQDYGIYEGKPRKDPGFLANKRQFATRYPGGESMFDVCHRIYSLIEDLKGKYPDQNVLLVCHGGVCRLIRSYFEDMTNEEYVNYCEENANIREYST